MSDLLIDGRLRRATGGRVHPNVNPATEEPIGDAADAAPEDLDAAIGAARRAFDATDWSANAEFRAQCLRQLREALHKERETLRTITVQEAGVPVALTHSIWLDTVLDAPAYWADLALNYPYERDLGAGDTLLGVPSRRKILREPVGVVAAITPWNYPLPLNLFKMVGALAAGCTVVLKSAPDTPWSGTELGRLVAEHTDIPAGVVNVISGRDPGLGAGLVADPRVDMVSFTGSTATGRKIMASASEQLKRVCLELGGKSANIVLDDADFPAVVGAAVSMCAHAGQGCALPTRMLLPRSRYEEGVSIAKASFESVSAGDPTDPAVIVGPLINAAQRERVLGYIETGRSEARLVVGGTPSPRPKGYYVEPALFADVDPGAVIAQEEIFGPVLSLIPYEDDDDAVRIANDSVYGLSGAVHSADLDRATGVARRIRTGTISVNDGVWLAPDTPFGGYKQSGLGREFGEEGFAEFLETKTLALPA
ncbi:aldehyde dehydrogenase family protein [Actinomadura madurae]|uniref:aldehyde dehydrogenase family protein n=1 Tax=Actinomadura madurae TaxID=1993 RepID=UPI000DA04C82|nr:aldehyde dehydrogenase family protein [Actinomadura madurae]SPT63938.1 Putative aldehyde dehydrogenase SA1924 [Actinomadura madurae]